MRSIQRFVVAQALFDGKHCRGKSGFHQFEVVQEPRGSSVTIDERMDFHEIRMNSRGIFDRVQALPVDGALPDERLHLLRYAQVIRRAMFRAGDYDILRPVSPGIPVIDILEHELMQRLDLPLGQRLGFPDHILDIENRLPVIDRLEMFAHGFAANGDPFKRDLRLLQGQRITLDGVGVVRPPDDKVVMQISSCLRAERPEAVEPLLQRIESVEVHCHYSSPLSIFFTPRSSTSKRICWMAIRLSICNRFG